MLFALSSVQRCGAGSSRAGPIVLRASGFTCKRLQWVEEFRDSGVANYGAGVYRRWRGSLLSTGVGAKLRL